MSQNNHFSFQQLPLIDVLAMDERSTDSSHNPYWNMRERLFHLLFERMTMAYSVIVPVSCRKFIEYVYLGLALLSLSILVYIHVAFIQTPVNCLSHVADIWPRDGILRVEIKLSDMDLNRKYSGVCSRDLLHEPITEAEDRLLYYNGNSYQNAALKENVFNKDAKFVMNNESATVDYFQNYEKCSSLDISESDGNVFNQMLWTEEEYIVEYSLEYGFLKLSPVARQKVNIPVLTVVLDPKDETCFGNKFSQLLLKHVVGYSDVLMSSLKNLVDKDENKGFVRNVVTGEQYRFVNKTLTWMSYISAAFIMMVFTLSVSMLLRYSHHQIFLFIVELLHVLEFNLHASFPAAPLLTVVLALVGMEAIMSEFFNDTTTAFYIILIVWIADQYDTIFCHTIITRRHWLRFFYLYHFAFYAYDYRFNGQYSKLALCTSCLFIQHSMIYFFHHYELPAVSRNAAEVVSDTDQDSLPPVENHSLEGENAHVDETAEIQEQSVAELPDRETTSNESTVTSVTCTSYASTATSNCSGISSASQSVNKHLLPKTVSCSAQSI